MDPKVHWERVHQTVEPEQASWFQAAPATSLDLIRRVAPDPEAGIIDVGGGASRLVDHLLDGGYRALTVLDVSPTALAVARRRLASRPKDGTAHPTVADPEDHVTWLEANVLTADLPAGAYDVWHDRAVFHFLTDAEDRRRYVAQVRRAVRPGGYVLIAGFGPDGPSRCSNLPVVRYASAQLHEEFGNRFELITSSQEHHQTPAGPSQQFVYCLLRLTEAR